jgi:hypothetical protein
LVGDIPAGDGKNDNLFYSLVTVCRADDDGARHHGHPEDRGRTQREGEVKIKRVVPWDYIFILGWGGGGS